MRHLVKRLLTERLFKKRLRHIYYVLRNKHYNAVYKYFTNITVDQSEEIVRQCMETLRRNSNYLKNKILTNFLRKNNRLKCSCRLILISFGVSSNLAKADRKYTQL